jgi:cell division protease FtsH
VSPESGPPDPRRQQQPKDGQPERRPRFGLFVILAVAMFLLLAQLWQGQQYPRKTISEVQQMIVEGQVESATMTTDTLRVVLKKDSEGKQQKYSATFVGERSKDFVTTLLREQGVKYEEDPTSDLFGGMFLLWILPLLIIGAVFWFLMRRMGPPQGVMNFGKSRAKIYAEKEVHVTFGDVAGADEAVEEVREIVEFLKEPKKFQALGARIPKGVLLLGAPGTGKTLLARAVAGEAGVPFFSLSGSDFVEMFVGVGASRVRDLFRQAEQQAPCLVFIDELDALGKTRGTSPISNDEREQTLNALLVEMDGFDANNGVIIIAATNRPEILDPALLRPGRFDRQIVVDRPDVVGRAKILDVHARKVKLGGAVDLEVIAKRTPGFSGADLANVINEAALLAARRDKSSVTMAELEEAIDRVMIGLERKRRGMTDREKEIVAAHETGHAIVAFHSPGEDVVHRISIIPRGVGTGGHTLYLPEESRMLYTREELIARIQSAMGGRAAERVVYGHLSTGASNDLEVATRIARHMITRYGMSERVGPVSLESEQSQFLRDPFAQQAKNFSEDTQNAVDDEVRDLIAACEKRAIEILERERAKLDEIRSILIEKEIIEREEFEQLMGAADATEAPTESLSPPDDDAEPGAAA